MTTTNEEVKVYGSFKFPIEGVQYAMGEVGGSWMVGGDDLGDDVRETKKLALKELLEDLREQLESGSKEVIAELVKKESAEREKEWTKKLETARKEYIKLQKKVDENTKV